MRNIRADNRWLGLLALIVACALGAAATPPALSAAAAPAPIIWPATPRFQHLTMDDGLPQNSVFQVLQDQQGMIWATTAEGISKYDGISFTTYTPQVPGATNPTPQYYQGMIQGSDGILWFANYGAGLVRYDPVADRWAYYQHDPDNPKSLASNTVSHLMEDRDGHLWVSTLAGLSRFDPETEQFTTYRHDPANPNSLGQVKPTQVRQAADGSFWIGTYDGGLDHFDPRTNTFTHYRHDPDDPNSLSNDMVEGLWIDADGTIWVATDGGLNHLTPQTGHFTRYAHDDQDPHSLSHNTVMQVMRDSRGVLWASTWGGGINRYDEERQQFVRYQRDPSNPDSLSSDIVIWFTEDRSGALWFATFGGINVFDPSAARFLRYQHIPGSASSLPAGRVRAVTQDAEGIFWIAMFDQGLVRFDRERNLYTRYQADGQSSDGLRVDTILSLEYDPRGWLWVGTTAGLNKLDIARNTWTLYQVGLANSPGLEGNWVSGLDLDAAGNLWMAVYGSGLYRFDPLVESFTRYRHSEGDPSSIANDGLNRVLVARDGAIWATGDASVSRFEPATETAINFTPEQHGLSGLTSDTIFQDRQGAIWIATTSGANRYDSATNQFTPYPGIRAVLADDEQGALWVITGRSLGRFDPRTGTMRQYDQRDGLLSTAFEPTAGYTTAAGEVFVGSNLGLNSFVPSLLTDNLQAPPVVLTSLLLFNEPLPAGDGSPLREQIGFAKEITLQHDQSSLTFTFAALSYRDSAKNQYAYRLEGFDKDWVALTGKEPRATYTNLPPGSYTFRAKAANNDGIWNEEGAALRITITPPWWELWWVRIFWVLGAAGLIYASFRWRLHSIRERNRQLELLVDQRTTELRIAKEAAVMANAAKSAFLANMSHELRSPLNAIINFTKFLDKPRYGGLTARQQELQSRVISNADHLLGLINDVLDLAKIESGKMDLLLERTEIRPMLEGMMSTGIGLTKEKPIELHLEAPDHLPPVMIDRTRVRQVLLNLLSNAAKFTEHGHITIRVTIDAQHLRIAVSDTGIGIAPENRERVFEEFSQVQDDFRRQYQGTGLGLPICKRLIELHAGEIGLESTFGEGSTFWFTLPIEGPPSAARDSSTGRVEAGPAFPSVAPPMQPQAPVANGTGPRVVIVDDDPESHRVLREQLAEIHAHVQTVLQSTAALETIRIVQPQLVLLDLNMPNMSGWDVLHALRSDPELHAIPVVICSVVDQPGQGLALGASDYLVKPVDEQLLLQIVKRWAPQTARVLVVDDDPDARHVIRAALEDQFLVQEAENGALGLAQIQSAPPDLVILDLMMPELDGFAVLEQIRQNQATAHLPVIVVSAKDLEAHERAWLMERVHLLCTKGEVDLHTLSSSIVAVLQGRSAHTHA